MSGDSSKSCSFIFKGAEMKEIIECEYCGKPFEKKNYNQKYCSKECYLKSNHPSQAVHEIRVCPGCGKEFVTKNASSSFCSKKCYAHLNNKRVRGWQRSKKQISESAFERVCNSLRKCGYEYVSGYESCQSKIVIKCLRCGTEMRICADSCRDNRPIVCKQCSRNERQKARELKKAELDRQRFINQLKPTKGIQLEFGTCQLCGGLIAGNRKKYCEDCSRIISNQRKEKRVEGKKKSSWTWQRLEKLTGNLTCQICGRECDPNDYEVRDGTFIAGNNYPSVDHIIPLSKGGKDTCDNLQIACRYCNSHKRDRLNYERVF